MALKRLNVIANGVEPAAHKRQFARDKGFEVWSSIGEAAGDYDVISSINVFSHLPDPAEFFSEQRRLLAKGGRFVIVTGNIGDLSFADAPRPLSFPDHLVFAGKQSLIDFFEGRLEIDVEDLHEYKEFFRTRVLEAKAKNVIKRLMGRTPSTHHKSGHKYFLMKIKAA